MNYGALIRDAWATTWRYRFLWLLGLFAGGTAGSIGGGGGSSGWRERAPTFGPSDPRMDVTLDRAASWAAANVGWLIAGAALVMLVAAALVVLALIAQGGMAEATVDLAQGRQTSLGQAWRTGQRLFWRYVGLWLLLALTALAVAGLVGAIVAPVVALVAASVASGASLPLIVTAGVVIVVGIPIALGLIAAAIGVSIVVAYAQRAIYAEDAGPVAALRAGWRVFRAHVLESALVWLINLALTIAAGIVGAVIMLPLVAVVGGIGYAVWAAAGFTAPLVTYAALGGLILIAGAALLVAVSNTFFWNYWTRAYLHLSAH